ncbi:DUF1772 domain-containing protein [Nocardioides speluncae]|uniref:anthrone oxygenase family protein n=1 Tax=Nocardioides speluncae TaxID=2670337 RepID=UPI000D697A33|nr:DUF1772 domain-containing protein [Nocardioides speluncae]
MTVARDLWVGLTLGAALVVMALVAGLNFTFAVAVMPNLAGVDDRTFVLITQRFNENPVFPLSFTLALLLTALACLLQGVFGSRAALRWTLAALVLYVVVLAITGGLHIPLNTEISDAGDPDRIKDLAEVRDRFETPWVVGNAVRTLFCTAAVAALGRALFLQGRR